jgi:hypothetical protein
MKLTTVLIVGLFCSIMLPGVTMANMVLNGGFEEGNFTSWDAFEVYVYEDLTTPFAAQSGSFSAVWNNAGPGFLKQELSTVAGQGYIVDFWTSLGAGYKNDGSFFTAKFGREVLVHFSDSDLTNPANWNFPPNYQHFVFPVIGTGNDTIEFSFYSAESEGWLDNISVNAVPIPGAVWLLGTGIVGLASVGRKTQK